MTQNKARKAAARQRMAETGEPYSVARRATQDHQPDTAGVGQIVVRYRLDRMFELATNPDTWAKADSGTRARLLAGSGGGSSLHPGITLAELIAQDLDDRGADAYAAPADGESGRDWEQEYYADGAASEGITVEEFKAREAAGRPRERPEDPAGEARHRAQALADRAQQRADLAQDRAEKAQGRAEEAQGRAEEAHGRAEEALDLADEAQDLAGEAREAVDEAREESDRESQEQAEREAARARERAERARERAAQAQEQADREQKRAEREQQLADREQERADREQDRAELEQERAELAQEWDDWDHEPGGNGPRIVYRHLRGMPRPPRPARPPQPPRPFR